MSGCAFHRRPQVVLFRAIEVVRAVSHPAGVLLKVWFFLKNLAVNPACEVGQPDVFGLVVDHDKRGYSQLCQLPHPIHVFLEGSIESHQDETCVAPWLNVLRQRANAVQYFVLEWHQVPGIMDRTEMLYRAQGFGNFWSQNPDVNTLGDVDSQAPLPDLLQLFQNVRVSREVVIEDNYVQAPIIDKACNFTYLMKLSFFLRDKTEFAVPHTASGGKAYPCVEKRAYFCGPAFSGHDPFNSWREILLLVKIEIR